MEIITILLIIAIVAIFVGSSMLKSYPTSDTSLKNNKDILVNPFISKITDDIYVSDAANALDYTSIKKLGIKQILIVGKELPRHGDMYFKVLHIKINDLPSENIKKYFNSSFNFIKKNKTLIHCAMGISRSVSITIAYLMRSQSMTFNEAFALVKKSRSIADPNPGFIEQLKKYETELTNKQSGDADDIDTTDDVK